jgi:hypothetical protein
MLDWLSSDDYQEHKPKVIIWEIPIYQNFKGKPFYKQVIPAVYGDCKGREIDTEKLVIENNKFETVSLFKHKNIQADNHYAFLKFDNFKGQKFRLTVEDINGNKSPFDYRRSKYYQPNGVYYFDFGTGNNNPIDNIKGLMPENTTGSVIIQICEYP